MTASNPTPGHELHTRWFEGPFDGGEVDPVPPTGAAPDPVPLIGAAPE